jgi:hypothetical protein
LVVWYLTFPATLLVYVVIIWHGAGRSLNG